MSCLRDVGSPGAVLAMKFKSADLRGIGGGAGACLPADRHAPASLSVARCERESRDRALSLRSAGPSGPSPDPATSRPHCVSDGIDTVATCIASQVPIDVLCGDVPGKASLRRQQPCDMAHLAAGTSLGLAVEVKPGIVLAQNVVPGGCVVAQEVGHHSIAVA